MESLSTWFQQIDRMARATTLWSALKDADLKQLKEVIKWRKRPYSVEYAGDTIIASKTINQDRLERMEYGNLTWPAWFYLQDKLNVGLQTIAPRLLWDASNEIRLFDVPDTLLAAMWLQFAQAVSGKRRYQQCGWCKQNFELTPGVGRADKKHCSPSCRVSYSRKYGGKKRRAKK